MSGLPTSDPRTPSPTAPSPTAPSPTAPSPTAPAPTAPARDLVLYDGVCGLCSGFTRFILARDQAGRFVFASLQSELAEALLLRHGRSARALDTVYVCVGYGSERESLHAKSQAVLFVLRALGGVWALASLAGILPGRFLDRVYDWVAARRYRVFGRSDVCFLPPPEQRARFVDIGAAPNDG